MVADTTIFKRVLIAALICTLVAAVAFILAFYLLHGNVE
jgi:hypothetical protein